MVPFEQVVPAATACQTTLPWSQSPNWEGPLQTTAPSIVHWPVLPVLPEDDEEKPVGAAEPADGPAAPWLTEGERVGYGGSAALEAGIVMVLNDDVGRTEALAADVEVERAALDVAMEDDWAEEAVG